MHLRCNRHGLELAPGSGQMYLGLNFSSILFEADLKLTVPYHDSVWFTCSGQFKMIGGMLYPNNFEQRNGLMAKKTRRLEQSLDVCWPWKLLEDRILRVSQTMYGSLVCLFLVQGPETTRGMSWPLLMQSHGNGFLSSNPAQIQSLGSRCKYVQVRPWEKPSTFQVAEAWICCGFVGKPKDEKKTWSKPNIAMPLQSTMVTILHQASAKSSQSLINI